MLYPNIRALREDRDLKQRQLADFYHVSVDYLLGRTAKPEMNE